MNTFLWMLAGGMLGWLGFSFLKINEGRGKIVSIIIGALGGFFGGKVIAPMFTAAAVPGDFNVSALVFALALAAAFMAIGNLVHNRWGV
jgi:uncharacterized membrane protein YeaQ/YmgE (transglycosylase-associated protein family)